MVKQFHTEEKILEAARKIFIKKGLYGARMQEIADEAGINKALLHYYFRTKDRLFYAIFREAFKTLVPVVSDMFSSDLSVEMKINRLAEKYIEILQANPYIPIFILNELHQNPERIPDFINLHSIVDFEKLTLQIKNEFGLENITINEVRHLFINFLSNMVFPFIGRPIIQFNFKMSDTDYQNFLHERKSIISKVFISSIKSINEYATEN